jgi:hypothetical protein
MSCALRCIRAISARTREQYRLQPRRGGLGILTGPASLAVGLATARSGDRPEMWGTPRQPRLLWSMPRPALVPALAPSPASVLPPYRRVAAPDRILAWSSYWWRPLSRLLPRQLLTGRGGRTRAPAAARRVPCQLARRRDATIELRVRGLIFLLADSQSRARSGQPPPRGGAAAARRRARAARGARGPHTSRKNKSIRVPGGSIDSNSTVTDPHLVQAPARRGALRMEVPRATVACED